VLPGEVRLLFAAVHSPAAALQSHAPVLQGPVGHIPPGITAIPSSREGRDAGQEGWATEGRERKEPCCREHQDEHRQDSAAGEGEGKQSHTVTI